MAVSYHISHLSTHNPLQECERQRRLKYRCEMRLFPQIYNSELSVLNYLSLLLQGHLEVYVRRLTTSQKMLTMRQMLLNIFSVSLLHAQA